MSVRQLTKIITPSILFILSGCGGGSSSTTPPTIPLVTPPANVAPTASAGADQNVNEQTQVSLAGSGSDTDGSITSYQWTQTAGTQVTLAQPDSATTTFTTPEITSDEVLTFQLQTTDNEGASASDTVDITVLNVNQLPTANAGEDQTITQQTQGSLIGSGTDADGSIVSYQWSQTAGPDVTITDATQSSTTFTTPNVRTDKLLSFALMVTDNDGATATDESNITLIAPPLFADTATVIDNSPAQRLMADINNNQGWGSILAIKAATESSPNSKIIQFKNRENGEFETIAFATELAHYPAVVIDFDGDQALDIIQTGYDGFSYNLAWLEQLGPQSFSAPQIIHDSFGTIDPVRGGPVPSPYVTDFNGDGHLDVVTKVSNTSRHTYDIHFFENSGNGSFTQQSLNWGNPSIDQPSYLMFNDFNHDGASEMVFSNFDAGGNQQLKLAMNSGDGTLSVNNLLFRTDPDSQSQFINHSGDFNNDGHIDILALERLTSNSGTTIANQYRLFLNDGSGNFADHQLILELPYKLSNTVIADIDNDGHQDIVFSSNNQQILWIKNWANGTFSSIKFIASYDPQLTLNSMIVEDLDNDGDKDIVSSFTDGHPWLGNGQIVRYENLLMP